MSVDPWHEARHHMVDVQIAGRGIRDPRVLAVMRETPRHLFVPEAQRPDAYADSPLPIGHGQTISQPYIVALMTELVRPAPGDRALDIGTGSGYQAAVLAHLVRHVRTVERDDALRQRAVRALVGAGVDNVESMLGDGYEGWPAAAPYDVIVVSAAPETVPERLVAQLAPGGRLVVPVGPVHGTQSLLLVERLADGTRLTRPVAPVRFVPMRAGLAPNGPTPPRSAGGD